MQGIEASSHNMSLSFESGTSSLWKHPPECVIVRWTHDNLRRCHCHACHVASVPTQRVPWATLEAPNPEAEASVAQIERMHLCVSVRACRNTTPVPNSARLGTCTCHMLQQALMSAEYSSTRAYPKETNICACQVTGSVHEGRSASIANTLPRSVNENVRCDMVAFHTYFTVQSHAPDTRVCALTKATVYDPPMAASFWMHWGSLKRLRVCSCILSTLMTWFIQKLHFFGTHHQNARCDAIERQPVHAMNGLQWNLDGARLVSDLTADD